MNKENIYERHGGTVTVTEPIKLTQQEKDENKKTRDLKISNDEKAEVTKIKAMTTDEKVEYLLKKTVNGYEKDKS